MGQCMHKEEDGTDDNQSNKNEVIKDKKQEKSNKDEMRLLLLGTAESGKSTLFKQMKILHMQGYDKQERELFIPIICRNILDSIYQLVSAMELLDIKFDKTENEIKAQEIVQQCQEFFNTEKGYPNPQATLNQLSQTLLDVWQDRGIQNAYSRRSEFHLLESAKYYFDKLDRITSSEYEPTDDDILKSRSVTTGVRDITFESNGLHFRMIDAGGQRKERRTWIHEFDNLTAILFVVSLSDYDQFLQEDSSTNRMHEALYLFGEIVNLKYLDGIPIIIFFNKADVFEEKIERVDLTTCFPQYRGGKNKKNALEYIMNKFMNLDKSNNRSFYTHVTTATNTNNIAAVFNATQTILLNNSLEDVGLL